MTTLARTVGVPRAVLIGLSSMVGAGVFFVWAPAAEVAGEWLPLGLLLAALLATANALSTAQLATALPVSGGAYAYGRRYLGPWTGFTAGWLFLLGKTASAAAIALIAGGYLWPEAARPIAFVVVVLLAAVNMSGLRNTATMAGVAVILVLVGLVAVLGGWFFSGGGPPAEGPAVTATPWGVLQSAGLIFFAFAGYARMATLGEEVRDPRRSLPKAILLALLLALLVYAAVALTLLTALGPAGLASAASPLAELVSAEWARSGVAVLAAVACLGSLAGILAGLSRTSLAMARTGDLPPALAVVAVRTNAPVVAEACVAIVAAVAVLVVDPASLVGFSATAVLGYYAVAHLAALRQPPAERWVPRAVSALGLAGCLVVALTLPWRGVLLAAALLAVGLILRASALRAAGRTRRP